MRGIHRSPVDNPYKGQRHGALIFSLNWARTNGWANNRDAGEFRRHRAHYDVTVMRLLYSRFPRYKYNFNPWVFVYLFSCTIFVDLKSYAATSGLQISWKHSAFVCRRALKVSDNNIFSRLSEKVDEQFDTIFLCSSCVFLQHLSQQDQQQWRQNHELELIWYCFHAIDCLSIVTLYSVHIVSLLDRIDW